jgi:hypothetical protein
LGAQPTYPSSTLRKKEKGKIKIVRSESIIIRRSRKREFTYTNKLLPFSLNDVVLEL